MPSPFEIDPTPYHLGECNAVVLDELGVEHTCSRPAIERRMSFGPSELHGDQRLCALHADEAPMLSKWAEGRSVSAPMSPTCLASEKTQREALRRVFWRAG